MPRRAGLTTAIVVQAAVDLLNREGPEALTLNRLAERLGVQPPSLYNHIGGFSDLKRELARLNAANLGECFTQAAVGKSGPKAIEAVAQAYRGYILENYGLYMASLRASRNMPPGDPQLEATEGRVVQVVLTILESFGLEGEDAVHAVRGLRSLVHGFATLEAAGGFGLPLDCDESFRRLVRIFIRGLEHGYYA
ncbi:MAG TPA: WHG domain-containing protein [Anaerolineaceae bacterium]|nr:WHG domain-containing protein [Anaerolineaceae bacterium]